MVAVFDAETVEWTRMQPGKKSLYGTAGDQIHISQLAQKKRVKIFAVLYHDKTTILKLLPHVDLFSFDESADKS